MATKVCGHDLQAYMEYSSVSYRRKQVKVGQPTPNCSSHLTSLNCLNADSTLTSAPCSKLCTDYLIFPLAFLILTQVELKVLSVLKAWVGLGQPGSARATNYCYAHHI